MAQQPPLFTSANGIHRLSISQENLYPSPTAPWATVPKPENSWTFTDLASAINIGMEILETPRGRAALRELGHRVVRGWAAGGRFRFGGNENHMPGYVDHFLSALRGDFPNVVVEHLGGPDVLGESRRISPPQWDGDLWNYRPKWAVGLYFNFSRVADMTAASATMWNTSEVPRREGQRMLNRHKQFQFLFSVATAHELCHAFTGYLSQGHDSNDARSYTPPGVRHLSFVALNQAGTVVQGESGRWFENAMFGGSFEFFRDRNDDHGQVGIPYLLDSQDMVYQIDPRAVLAVVDTTEPRERRFHFPLRTTGPGLNSQQLVQLRMGSLGRTMTGASMPAGMTYMRARPGDPRMLYDVPATELRRVPVDPRPIRAIRVA